MYITIVLVEALCMCVKQRCNIKHILVKNKVRIYITVSAESIPFVSCQSAGYFEVDKTYFASQQPSTNRNYSKLQWLLFDK